MRQARRTRNRMIAASTTRRVTAPCGPTAPNICLPMAAPLCTDTIAVSAMPEDMCAPVMMLLAGPDDAFDDGFLAQRVVAVLEGGIERLQHKTKRRHAAQLLGHHFPAMGLQ